jgi:hypothetical protein
MAEQTKYIYICSNNHDITSDKPIKKCLAMVHGKPCTGTLKSVGKGSRSANKETK